MTSRRSPVHRSKRTEKTGRVSARPGPPARSGLAGPCASLRRTPRPRAGGRRPAGEGAVIMTPVPRHLRARTGLAEEDPNT